MGIKKKQENNKEIKNNKIDASTFKRISDKFSEYWHCLFRLIFFYIAAYLFWALVVTKCVKNFTDEHQLNGDVLWFTIIIVILQGLLFSLDGFVTSLLKSPFNQMCYAINKAEEIPDKKKDYIITKATESNEHCKETLKKFGIITIAAELLKTFVKVAIKHEKDYRTVRDGNFEYLMVISYLIPIFFAALDIWKIHWELKKIKKTITFAHGGKK